jgi:hypothetical protein
MRAGYRLLPPLFLLGGFIFLTAGSTPSVRADGPNDATIEGALGNVAINPASPQTGSVLIGGLTLTVDRFTAIEIEGPHGRVIGNTLAALQGAIPYKAKAEYDPATRLAQEVEVEVGELSFLAELKGPLAAVTANPADPPGATVVVGGVSLAVNAFTPLEIDGPRGAFFSNAVASLQSLLGQKAEIDFDPNTGLVRKIEIDVDEDAHEAEIRGVLSAVNVNPVNPTLANVVIGGTPLTVSWLTKIEIEGPGGRLAGNALAHLPGAIGRIAEAEYDRGTGFVYEVEVDSDAELRGIVTAVGGSALGYTLTLETPSGARVMVNGDFLTEIKIADLSVTNPALLVGHLVEAEYDTFTLRAGEIESLRG